MVQGYGLRWAYQRPGPEEGQRDEPKRGAGGTRIPMPQSLDPPDPWLHRPPITEARGCPRLLCASCMLAKRVLLEGRIDVYDSRGELPIAVVRSSLVEGGGEIVWLTHLLMRFLTVCPPVPSCYKAHRLFWVGTGPDAGLQRTGDPRTPAR